MLYDTQIESICCFLYATPFIISFDHGNFCLGCFSFPCRPLQPLFVLQQAAPYTWSAEALRFSSATETPPGTAAIWGVTGLITKGMDGTDVMQSGEDERRYQIYQGKMGQSILYFAQFLLIFSPKAITHVSSTTRVHPTVSSRSFVG